ncbi:MAG TPA: glycosyltransferase [Terriglobia bacterium]|nr:glycosyltransferase [Terriglobia bacterium]
MDLRDVSQPAISVVTPSLNHGRFLRQTIESVAAQTFRNFEHIVVDGGSTDDTVKILKEFPHLRWVSERDEHVVEAYQKAFAMARGRYIIQCCVSDGFLDPNWFRKCVEVLEKDDEVSLVWGFAQTMSEEGDLLNVCFQDFFTDPPPQKQDFLAFWLVSGFPLPEGNYCARSEVIRAWFPDTRSSDWFRTCPHLGFMYRFFAQGYSPYFIPVVANFGRLHHDQRSQRLRDVEKPGQVAYRKAVNEYGKSILKGSTVHRFRNGTSQVIGQILPQDLSALRKKMWRHRLLRSPLLRRDPYTLALKLKERIFC